MNGFSINKILKIKSIKRLFNHYDLTVANNHNYIVHNKILVHNSDFEQLAIYKNVKLFSPITKLYKHISNPSKILAKKIEKETADNLVTPILTTADYEKRKTIVNLMELPSLIEQNAAEALSQIVYKEYDIEQLMFPTLKERFHKLYNSNKIVSYDKKKRKKRKVASSK
jgi:hypothetical protein